MMIDVIFDHDVILPPAICRSSVINVNGVKVNRCNFIPCRVCSTNNDDSCVDCTSPNEKISSGIWSIGTVFRPYAIACVRSNGACV